MLKHRTLDTFEQNESVCPGKTFFPDRNFLSGETVVTLDKWGKISLVEPWIALKSIRALKSS